MHPHVKHMGASLDRPADQDPFAPAGTYIVTLPLLVRALNALGQVPANRRADTRCGEPAGSTFGERPTQIDVYTAGGIGGIAGYKDLATAGIRSMNADPVWSTPSSSHGSTAGVR